MFLIITYDVNKKRCSKYQKLLSKYLIHISNSVFHGSISNKKYELLLSDINKMKIKEDKLLIYEIPKMTYLNINFLKEKAYKVVY